MCLHPDKQVDGGCCGLKVRLPSFPVPPGILGALWTVDTPAAKLFRANSRSFNNALALSSIKVTERRFQGYSPSVIFEGKVFQYSGPLQAEDGEDPKFAQLYVKDPALERAHREGNMSLPASMSQEDRQTMYIILNHLQELLKETNPYIKDFKMICEIPEIDLLEGQLIISAKAKPADAHPGRYNLPTSLTELSILTNAHPHDLVVKIRGGGLQRVSDLNPSAMPLHFTLLFPYGTKGWDMQTKHVNSQRRVTPREFFAYHMQVREDDGDYLFMGGRLFQEWACMGWVTVENQKLAYQRLNQKQLRADTYRNVREVIDARQLELAPVTDAMGGDDHNPRIGRKVLSSSFVGSMRWYNGRFQDSMAIVRKFRKPDYFITQTCNPHWDEILSQLNGALAQDRPDLVARVFKMKKDQLIDDIMIRKVFGVVPAKLWVIEFQKRGLPHAHILVILREEDRLTTAAEVDETICAELPPDPEEAETDEAREQLVRLNQIVLTNMVHGPCGEKNRNSPCMVDGRCSKNYPKPLCSNTIIDPNTSHPQYRRRKPAEGGRTAQIKRGGTTYTIDNGDIVPYSPYLSLRYNCHINVVHCSSATACKYLYKYVTKGSDRAMVRSEVEGYEGRDEIAEYEDLRSVGSSEAAWHLNAFPIARNTPAVCAMRVHLEDGQQINFDEGQEEDALETGRITELTAFFNHNGDPNVQPEDKVQYVDMPEKYRYDQKQKLWIKRKNKSDTIGRVHSVNPIAGDVFYLRLLLHNDHCKGKTSFEDLRTVNGDVCDSFKEACTKLGLLQDDNEWHQVLTEADYIRSTKALRELYVTIALYCEPADPGKLFEDHWESWTDDIVREAQQRGVTLEHGQLRTMVLLDIKRRLQSREKDLCDVHLATPTEEQLSDVEVMTGNQPVMIREELDFDTNQLKELVTERYELFTEEQRHVFDTVVNAVKEETPLQAFMDARGGCGKTFVLNAILAAVRSMTPGGCVALAMATTGIAANLLSLGRTFHSRMKAPLTPTEESMFNITGQSTLAELIRMAKLLIIDEATMLHRYQLEAMDRTLKDIMGNDLPFGGKVLVLSGDFRQCLPVVPGASRAGVVDICINRSILWRNFTVLKLTENMRVRASGDVRLKEFDQWLLSLGDGTAPFLDGNSTVELPEEQCVAIEKGNEAKSMSEFCEKIFPNLNENISDENWLKGRKILAPTNKEVDKINNLLVDKMAGDLITLHSSDSLDNDRDAYRYNVEYINTLNPTGLPASRLCLKPGMPVMLMRNLNPTEGLCNGTQMIFKKMLSPRLMVCRTVGQEVDRDVYIPRITLRPKEKQYPFEWSRRQFPIKAAFSTTVNKSQGQTMRVVGVWLIDAVFSHGQLYVAGSRVGAPERLWFAVRPDDAGNRNHTRNVVYREVLTDPAVQPHQREDDEANFDLGFQTPVEVGDMPEYEGDDAGPNFNLEVEEEEEMVRPAQPSHSYNLRPREKRSCPPAKREARPPRTVPR